MFKAMDLFAGTNGQAARDWSAELLMLYGKRKSSGDSALKAELAKRVLGTTPSLTLSAYVGTYSHPAWGSLVVTMNNGALYMTLGSNAQQRGPLQHWHYDTFFATLGDGRGNPTTITFVLDADGKVAAARFEDSDGFVFKR